MKVTIIDHQADWKDLFTNEKEKINRLIGFLGPAIVHIGSTSVPGLCAKPTIDIQVGLENAGDLDRTIEAMQLQYTYVKLFEPDWPARRFYCKYENETGLPVPSIIDVGDVEPVKQGLTSLCNIHVFVRYSDDWIRHIAFRDYLANNKEDRDAYCRLKKELARNEYDNMIAYNNAKNDFVKEIQRKALEWYSVFHKID
jgi:GrpB-like predicted nucleotidyltransferase (UPF0157 family)